MTGAPRSARTPLNAPFTDPPASADEAALDPDAMRQPLGNAWYCVGQSRSLGLGSRTGPARRGAERRADRAGPRPGRHPVRAARPLPPSRHGPVQGALRRRHADVPVPRLALRHGRALPRRADPVGARCRRFLPHPGPALPGPRERRVPLGQPASRTRRRGRAGRAGAGFRAGGLPGGRTRGRGLLRPHHFEPRRSRARRLRPRLLVVPTLEAAPREGEDLPAGAARLRHDQPRHHDELAGLPPARRRARGRDRVPAARRAPGAHPRRREAA